MLCKKEAATFLDSDPQIQEIIEKALQDEADRADLNQVEQALKNKFPARPLDTSVSEVHNLTRLEQDDGEPLIQYFSRVQNALRQAGGRDRPRRPGNTSPLTPAEATLLRTVVSRFVDGLKDYELKQEALTNRARNADSLWRCLEIIQDSQRVLADKARAAKEEEERAQIDAIRKALAERRDLTVERAVAEHQQKKRSRKPRKPRVVGAPPKPLSEIRARKGEGAFDYQDLLKRTTLELSLVDVLQISPDFCKNLRHLSTRTGEKVEGTARR
ncbi:hypothetical protein DL766_006660 [Monosporascus sp. MC13-8B]|nr:hypothetical protein DL766_006660 [Monosporascus sp. MC13-8B]